MSAIIPIPKFPINVRPATMEDLSFIDGLQKIHTKMVGWMPEKALVGKIKLGHVLVAESDEATKARSDEGEEKNEIATSPAFPSVASSLRRSVASSPLGYLIGNDQYFKRDDVGIIYQMNVVPGKQRAFVGATLLKAMFDRAAYGCRLYCCWCAQDIEANRFWESLGFVPLAFRAGSEKKRRVHIFWQKRIRQDDETTPYWFPSQTNSGSIREDRLVFPIPPGMHWSDEMPRVLPKSSDEDSGPRTESRIHALPGKRARTQSSEGIRRSGITSPQHSPLPRTTMGRLQFNVPAPAKPEKPKAEKKPKCKNDPKLVAAARELRDRWLERVNEDPSMLVAQGKYQVARAIESAVETPMKLLSAA